MDLSTIPLSLDIVAGTLTIFGGLLAALWAENRFF